MIQAFFKTSKFNYLSESHSYISEFLKLFPSTSKISWNTVLNIYSLFAIKCVIVFLLWRTVSKSVKNIIKNHDAQMHILDTWGAIWEEENTAPDPKAKMVEKRPTQILQESNSLAFPLFHPGEDKRNIKYRLRRYCLFQLSRKKRSRQEGKEVKVG